MDPETDDSFEPDEADDEAPSAGALAYLPGLEAVLSEWTSPEDAEAYDDL